MTEPLDRSTSALEEEGIPDTLGGLDDSGLSDIEDEYTIPPSSRPASLDHGTTVNEMREGETLDDRIRREEPDLTVDDDTEVYGGGDEPAGRLVEDDEGAREDTTKETVAYDVGGDSGGFSAEEAAMHVTDNP
jgi:hypothetical protein